MSSFAKDNPLILDLETELRNGLRHFQYRARLAGKNQPEAVLVLSAGERGMVEVAEQTMRDLLWMSSRITTRMVCTITPRMKKIEELERAEKQVNTLKAELAALPEA